MMGSILDGVVDDWRGHVQKIDLIKVSSPKNRREGINYFYEGNLPKIGARYDEVWLGVKPQQLAIVAKNIAQFIDSKTLIISILAGVSLSDIQNIFGVEAAIRAMPNANSVYGNGQTALVFTTKIPQKTLESIIADFEKIGDVHILPEEKINPFTAVAGSGPAYVYHIFGAIYRALREQFDLPKDEAKNLVLDAAAFLKKPKDEFSQFETSKNKGSLEGLIISAAKDLGHGRNREEISHFVSDVILKISNSLIKAAESLGFDKKISESLISGPRGIVKASAITAQKTQKDFLQLKNAVTSVNGTTQAALGVIEVGAGRTIDELFKQGLEAARKRAEELSGESRSFMHE